MSHLNNTFFSNKVQEIHARPDGKIILSSDTIFKIEPGKSIFDLHPFFESLQTEFSSVEDTNLAFPCVQLEVQENSAICDITIKKQRGFLAILLFDYSNHYKNVYEAAQEKKTSMLNEQAYVLGAKYSEEKKTYLEFIHDRIDTKIIQELKTVVTQLDTLKKTTLSLEQTQLVNQIDAVIGNIHDEAVQIKIDFEVDLD